jgi:protease I
VLEERAGPLLVSPKEGTIQGLDHLTPADAFRVDRTVDRVRADEIDGLVLPGGVANPDMPRTHDGVRRLVREVVERGTPVGFICHVPWTLIDAGAAAGRTLTSWPSLRTDLVNAGAGGGRGGPRGPGDRLEPPHGRPPAFCAKLVEELAEGRHELRAA